MNQSIHQPNNQLISEWRNGKKVPCARHRPQRFAPNCLVKWRNGSIIERPALPWPVSFPCETLCGSELWALGHSTAPDLLPVLFPSRVGIDADHFLARYLRVRTPIHLYLSPKCGPEFCTASVPITVTKKKKKKKGFKRRQAGTSLVVQWLLTTCQCREFHPWSGKWFSTQGLNPHLLLGKSAYHWITKEALCYSS